MTRTGTRGARRRATTARPRKKYPRRKSLRGRRGRSGRGWPLSVALVLAVAGGAWFAAGVLPILPTSDDIGGIDEMATATLIFDAFDEPIFTLSEERRVMVPLSQISPELVAAVVAVEDHRFYDHRGFDLIRIAGAAAADVAEGRLAQGGSTITQQLARTSLLTRERTFRRKAAELVTAVRIERAYAKTTILELYLNKVYLGAGFYGVEAASRGYFGKPTTELTLSEAALLAGLIQAPSRYAPVNHPERALARREIVLDAMLATGAAGPDEIDRARQEPLTLRNGLDAPPEFGGYFKEEVRRRLVERFGADAVYRDGLRVYTTLVPEAQRAAEAAAAEGLQRIEAMPRFRRAHRDGSTDALQTALIALDPRSGAVAAVVGGRDFAASPFNRATQATRQPGSAFKPFLYAAAVEGGLPVTTWLADLDRPTRTAQGDWLPDDEAEGEAMTARAALRLSSNRAAVRLLELTGIDRTVAYADRFALGDQPAVPSLALGSGTVTLERLTAAYGAFAAEGQVPTPTYVRRIETADGEVLFEAPLAATGARAIRPATAFVVASLLRDVVDRGTGSRVRREGFTGPAGGKTGTTDQYRDAWFVGFTPDLVAGVWVGFDQPRTIMPLGYASDLAAPMWARFMREAGPGAGAWLERPDDVRTVEVCALSGARANPRCRLAHAADLAPTRAPSPTYEEYFVAGTEPTEHCPLHPEERGLLARVFGRDEPAPTPPPAAPARSATADGGRVASVAAFDVAVKHDHVFGSCRGRLVADDRGLRYVTSHRDAFTISYGELERFELDGDTLRVRPRDGRRYNFTSASGTPRHLRAFVAGVGETRSGYAMSAP